MNTSDYSSIVDRALEEDLLNIGDVTTDSVIGTELLARAALVSRKPGVIAGLDVARYVFEKVDANVEFLPAIEDGDHVAADDVVADVSGRARSILIAERTALNLLGRMSGVATETARLVALIEGTGALISDTRKTMPGLRVLDKYAVSAGGGINHRMGLYDAVLIKDNHIAAAGDILAAVKAARARVGPDMIVEVEVDTLDQLRVVLETDADRVLLDNMDPATLRHAVEIAGDRIVTEASGGVTVETVRDIAETGVDIISVGSITHSAPQLDVGLDFLS
ncbi:MAG: carboxylating nicotinate-nucleotide diphosphorylase [Acidimicrobiia bacterium]